jgi:hypothetical protein
MIVLEWGDGKVMREIVASRGSGEARSCLIIMPYFDLIWPEVKVTPGLCNWY